MLAVLLNSEAMIQIAMIRLMLQRLGHGRLPCSHLEGRNSLINRRPISLSMPLDTGL
jgi:hypothetical protein